ncbi:DUF1697 domain-containing protein [Nocardia camponoti]|uniref:DUF1697 domain-containing protein n=1 Tax=Nocardia camponoti TaxID=1616106 RepID=A0A917QCZ9_9NOCA|nr:DUF1697 domain-containing protein [Nocardia camponoti]GGK44150.1 hypothetical protein GCM10011591_14620 [Nocardia camponoti]
MTERYAALLRGIMPSNPNMRNEKLRGVLEGLGYERVASILASGNLTFATKSTDPAVLEDRIQQALSAELGIPGGTLIRSYPELRDLLDRDPFDGRVHERGTYLTVTFFKNDVIEADLSEFADDPLTKVIGYDHPTRAFLTVLDNSTGVTPPFMGRLEKIYGKDITTRTWLTVQRVVKKMES